MSGDVIAALNEDAVVGDEMLANEPLSMGTGEAEALDDPIALTGQPPGLPTNNRETAAEDPLAPLTAQYGIATHPTAVTVEAVDAQARALVAKEAALQESAANTLRQTQAALATVSDRVEGLAGPSVLGLSEVSLHQLLDTLRQRGQALAATKVEKIYYEARDAVGRYQQQAAALATEKELVEAQRHHVEWGTVRRGFLDHVPGLADHMMAVVNQIYLQAHTDPTYDAAIATQAGKAQQVYKALDQLGLLAKIREQQRAAAPTSATVPDSQAGRQSVRPLRGHVFTREEIARMSQAEFVQHEAMIDEQLRKGLIQ
jgi:hypothetical protein